MKCTNCGQEMHGRDFCIFCGYMKNGNFISKKRKETLEDLERYLDKDYQKVLRNETYVATFLLGPLYLCYKKCFVTGFLLEVLNAICFLLVLDLTSRLGPFSFLCFTAYLCFNKFLWMTIDNMIYLKLVERKINKIKEIYKENYKEVLEKKEKKSVLSLVIAILLYILICFFILIIYWIDKGRL